MKALRLAAALFQLGIPWAAAAAPPNPQSTTPATSITPATAATSATTVTAGDSGSLGEIVLSPGAADEGTDGAARRIESAVRELSARGGGTVRLTPGVYALPNPPSHRAIDLSGIRGVTLAGTGDSTILACGKDFPDAFLHLSKSGNVTIRNLTFRGLALDSSAWGSNRSWHTGIRIRDCDNVVVRDNRFSGFYTGGVVIQGAQSGLVVVRGNVFENVSHRMGKGDYGAVAVEEARGAHILDNVMTGITHSGVSAYHSGNLLIRGNAIRGDKRALGHAMGIYCVRGLSGSVLSSNRIHDIAEEGIILDGQEHPVADNVIAGNTITARFSGITVNLWRRDNDVLAATDNLIMDNDISSYDALEVEHGIFLNRNARARVLYNRITAAATGINLQNSSRGTTLSGNVVDASGTCLKLNGSLTASDNQLRRARYGIVYSHSAEATIARNAFLDVSHGIVKGKDVAGDNVFDNR